MQSYKEKLDVSDPCFYHLEEDFSLPDKFTFPFAYEPHPIAKIAAQELQVRIENILSGYGESDFYADRGGVGKMFGVLIVKNKQGRLGYLSAFSGKWGEATFVKGFVPPVFDTLDPNGFYKREEQETNKLNRKIEALEESSERLSLLHILEVQQKKSEENIDRAKNIVKDAKIKRDKERLNLKDTLDESTYAVAIQMLDNESISHNYRLKDVIRVEKANMDLTLKNLQTFDLQINEIKRQRKQKSAELQHRLFSYYDFLNQAGQSKNLIHIFEITDEIMPPSGAGECAAPKLLQHAFKNQYEPVAMAEFWWGKSPQSEVRKHGYFYPACNGKCKPILSHMLEGIDMDDNPMLLNPGEGRELPIVYEDDYILVVDKPAEFLSVPGKTISDSVLTRMKKQFPYASGPLIVHRLDMSTSGLLLIAKDKDTYIHLQDQFIKRSVKKRYQAILAGIVKGDEGVIELPLRVDLDDRPRQLVCYEYGKPSVTRWERIEVKNGETRVYFYPETGRTHQLRVHSAHVNGLHIAIKGDDIYGEKNERLFLHAERISFVHPATKERMTIEAKCPF